MRLDVLVELWDAVLLGSGSAKVEYKADREIKSKNSNFTVRPRLQDAILSVELSNFNLQPHELGNMIEENIERIDIRSWAEATADGRERTAMSSKREEKLEKKNQAGTSKDAIFRAQLHDAILPVYSNSSIFTPMSWER